MIEIEAVSKRYGDKLAVDDLSFTVHPGRVTGFLGPNGSGKSTTMRMIVGLDTPTSGQARVNGKRYADYPAPLTQLGALLEARGVHPGRTADAHLRALAATHGIGRRRVSEVLDTAGLTEVASRRAGGFSLGMSQRLGIAAALLGDPRVVILDEPTNGLDLDGVRWIRTLLRDLAAEGRTVFISSHLMSEVAMTADQVIVIGRGRLIADVSVDELTRTAARGVIRVRTPDAARLRELLAGPGVTVTSSDPDSLEVEGVGVERIGELARDCGAVVYELTPQHTTLEEAFMALTNGTVEFHAGKVTA